MNRLTRRGLFGVIAAVWIAGTAWLFSGPIASPNAIVVTHWANGHMMRPDLLPAFAERFNRAGVRGADGRVIWVKVVGQGSAETTDELISRAGRGVPVTAGLPDPTIVTPSADHWLAEVNRSVGRQVVDLAATRAIATTWIGIATYREMAECLGWPNREIGFADIIALRNDPRGWAAYPCARTEWGKQPLVAFTDPLTSTTGRSVLFTLYAIAAGKPAEQLTAADVRSPAIREYVHRFQSVVDHYVVGTLPLNTKIFLGPRYGHFFFIPEDNLVHLYEGTESVQIGIQTKRAPITRPMVMIYPKEGSTQHSHSAAIVRANWVTGEQAAAAERWIDYLQGEEQQRILMAQGFRPATGLPLTHPISSAFGLDPGQPTRRINPDRIDGAAAAAIIGSWDEVKRPGVVTFVVDVSGSMKGKKLAQAKDGVLRALDAMSRRNHVGLVTFSSEVHERRPVALLAENRFELADTVRGLSVRGGTALYDGIQAGIEMTDSAPGLPDAIRAVVVLTDGQANQGATRLHDLIRITTLDEKPVREFGGMDSDSHGRAADGRWIEKKELIGQGLAQRTRYPVLIFFVGVGEADFEIGRLLAEATGASFNGATEKDLAAVLEQFGKYF